MEKKYGKNEKYGKIDIFKERIDGCILNENISLNDISVNVKIISNTINEILENTDYTKKEYLRHYIINLLTAYEGININNILILNDEIKNYLVTLYEFLLLLNGENNKDFDTFLKKAYNTACKNEYNEGEKDFFDPVKILKRYKDVKYSINKVIKEDTKECLM